MDFFDFSQLKLKNQKELYMYLNIFIAFVILIVIITAISIQNKNTKKSVKEHLENCQFGQKSATAKGNVFFTNSMLSSFFQRDQALNLSQVSQ